MEGRWACLALECAHHKSLDFKAIRRYSKLDRLREQYLMYHAERRLIAELETTILSSPYVDEEKITDIMESVIAKVLPWSETTQPRSYDEIYHDILKRAGIEDGERI